MNSSMFRLQAKDFAKGAALAVFTAFLGALYQALKNHGFDFGAYEWNAIFTAAATAFSGYLAQKFLSDENGKVFGAIG